MSRTFVTTIFLILSGCILYVSSVIADDDNMIQIQAGRRIGVNGIGEKRAAILRDMGKPETHYTLPGGIAADSWGDGETRMFYRRNAVIQMSVKSIVDPLPGNITMDCTPAQVTARHPGLHRREYTAQGSGGGSVDYYDDPVHGIAFEFTRAMNPMPGDSVTPKMYAVIVHQKGTAVIPDAGETPASH